MKRCSMCAAEFDERFELCPVDGAAPAAASASKSKNQGIDKSGPSQDLLRPLIEGSDQMRLDFRLTLIEDPGLTHRLTNQFRLVAQDSEISWTAFKKEPLSFLTRCVSGYVRAVITVLKAPNVSMALTSAMLVVLAVALTVVLCERLRVRHSRLAADLIEVPNEFVITMLQEQDPTNLKTMGAGYSGKGSIGINRSTGEGSASTRQKSSGGGGSGDHNRQRAQQGKIPADSPIQAAIPILPLNQPPLLPTAGIIFDPALYKDLPLDRYGDPRSKSIEPSAGTGNGGGIGDGNGTGIGDGDGPGLGPGRDGNTGGGKNQRGCCGPGNSPNGNGSFETTFTVNNVQVKARIILKPEPRYTEEARKNQITGTVILKAVLSSSGTVINVKPMSQLPFGLTEEAILAARHIKFIPAIKDQHAVSQWIQIEYNFNLY